jgi:hypothetical protein
MNAARMQLLNFYYNVSNSARGYIVLRCADVGKFGPFVAFFEANTKINKWLAYFNMDDTVCLSHEDRLLKGWDTLTPHLYTPTAPLCINFTLDSLFDRVKLQAYISAPDGALSVAAIMLDDWKQRLLENKHTPQPSLPGDLFERLHMPPVIVWVRAALRDSVTDPVDASKLLPVTSKPTVHRTMVGFLMQVAASMPEAQRRVANERVLFVHLGIQDLPDVAVRSETDPMCLVTSEKHPLVVYF